MTVGELQMILRCSGRPPPRQRDREFIESLLHLEVADELGWAETIRLNEIYNDGGWTDQSGTQEDHS